MTEEGPISAKERIAKFQNLINNANNNKNTPPLYNPTPKTNPPLTVTSSHNKSISPSSTSNTQKYGEVQSPSISKPSAMKGMTPNDFFKVQNITSNQTSVSPSVARKTPEPTKEINQLGPSFSNNSPSKQADSSERLSVNALKMMMQGKNLNFNKPQQDFPNRISRSPQEQEQIIISGKTGEPISNIESSRPEVETQVPGNVRENAQKLNQFFTGKVKEEGLKKEESPVIQNMVQSQQKNNISNEKIEENKNHYQTQNNTQNITPGLNLYAPEEVNQEQPAIEGRKSLAEAIGGQDGGVMARLQKRKRTNKKEFSSDSD